MMLAHAFAFSEQDGNQLPVLFCFTISKRTSQASLPEMTSDQAN